MPDWNLSPLTVHVNHSFSWLSLSHWPVIPLTMNLLFGSKLMIFLFINGLIISQGDKIVGKGRLEGEVRSSMKHVFPK